MERSTGSMGSQYTTYRFFPDDIPRLAKLDWNSIARRVFIDPATGLIALMSPSSRHETHAWGAGRAVHDIARHAGMRAIALGATRWRLPDDPENTGAEPDACYYLGENAERWSRTHLKGEAELNAFEEATPPDLVIEVERSRGDADKPLFYRRLGVPEMWRIDISGNTREAIMLNLQAPDGPEAMTASAVLPPANPAFVLEALELAVHGRLDELDTLIVEHLSRQPDTAGSAA
ncbi:MAG: Uma2 family endonuclease [Alphaproteobacteria bacterium]|nr:Uma2 family endonuclease [Alphaproteobacteria bacterium]